MPTCYRLLWLTAVALTLVAAPLAADQPPPAAQQAALLAAVKAADYPQVFTLARQILLSAAACQTPLTGPDLFAVAQAHQFLMAEAYDKALKAGGLPEPLAQLATAARDELLAEKPRMQTVSKGETIKLEDYLTPGKTTIVDFYSDFCPPCRSLTPRLEALLQKRPDLTVVKVDINRPGRQGIDWQSPVARQFSLQSIPHLKLYGPDGQLISEGRPAMEQVFEWIQAAQ